MTSLLKLSRPLRLLLAALTYIFGASLADYLGKPFRADSFWFGLVSVLFAQVSMNLLPEVFRLDIEPLLENEIRKERIALRNNILYISIAALTADVVIAFSLYINQRLSSPAILFYGFSILLILAYAIPPLRLINRGFGELILAVHLAYVIPSISFLLQAGKNHPLLVFAIPLTLLAFAYFVVLNFPSFAEDKKYNRITFLLQLGWERVVPFHHAIVLLAYILFLAASALNIPFSLYVPAFLTFPFAILQIILLRHISLGGRPNWTLLNATALAVFGLTTYFLTLTFWLR